MMLFSYDMEGALLWKRDWGGMDSIPRNKGAQELDCGYSNSSMIYEDKIYFTSEDDNVFVIKTGP